MEMFVDDSSLERWEVIGSGGFGQIYKARHCRWACDVAVKLLRHDDGTGASLQREIDMMRQASSPHVIRVRGVFRGRLPHSGPSMQLGVVMELMERGSLADLQLTDFGLSRISCSVSQVSKTDDEEVGGTVNYMPPEAFQSSYKPNRACDIYRYFRGLDQPPGHSDSIFNHSSNVDAKPTRVKLLIPEGQRPLLDDIRGQAAGLAELTELMKRCWDNIPEQRPSALECTTETEELYKIYKHAMNDAVHEVLKKLDQNEEAGMTEYEAIQPMSAARGGTICRSAPMAALTQLSRRCPTFVYIGGMFPTFLHCFCSAPVVCWPPSVRNIDPSQY
ncbi:hypothetical protein FQN60_014618 [Etheostoma spectabile]|uniref:Protein kinase domain-containing protein n=1 Tax=Etheostoma spectabile TaxID=54343 RepID=A0A5J5DAX5_9PERO|nr:hypothetical protein FQN60_014602 [Etheostoma spectabile]KAA8590684.1 hypothetical protein FQN60_014618 [Etheostoma spectabile]